MRLSQKRAQMRSYTLLSMAWLALCTAIVAAKAAVIRKRLSPAAKREWQGGQSVHSSASRTWSGCTAEAEEAGIERMMR